MLIHAVRGGSVDARDEPTMTKDTARDLKPVPNRDWSERNIGHIGQPRAAFMAVTDVHQNMAVTNSDTHDQTVTIALADVGAAVPAETTCDVRIVPTGLEIDRRGETFIVERDGDRHALTGVVGRSELPTRVPDWIPAVAEWFGIDEVALGR